MARRGGSGVRRLRTAYGHEALEAAGRYGAKNQRLWALTGDSPPRFDYEEICPTCVGVFSTREKALAYLKEDLIGEGASSGWNGTTCAPATRC